MLHDLVISHVEHPWNKIKSDYGCPKKRKDGMPKKHDPKKKRERGNHVSKKKRQGWFEREKPLGVSHIHPSTHTLASFFRDCMTCFSMDPLFDFTINGMQVCPVLILSWAPQRLLAVGKTEGRYCPGEDNKSWVPRESHPGNFAMFSKTFQKVSPDGLQIYEQVSTSLCTALTLNNPRQGDN